MTDECTRLKTEIKDLEKKLRSTIEKKESLKLMVSRVEVEEYELMNQLKEKKLAFRTLTETTLSSSTPSPSSAAATSSDPSGQPGSGDNAALDRSISNQRMRGILSNVKEYYGLVEKLPLIPVNFNEPKDISYEDGYRTNRVMGPHDPESIAYQEADTIGTRIAARTEGNPICDHYIAEINSDYTFVTIGDGCNWGARPLEASIKATEGFISHTILNYTRSEDTHDIGKLLLESFASAHNGIISGKRDIWSAGTTTLIGSIIFPLENAEYGVLTLSIGDYARDPGGRIGPYVGDGMPDTRNLSLFFNKCRENDFMIYCTDGVHDNLDAESLGVDPGEFTKDFDGMTWSQAEAADKSLAEEIKSAFYEARLEMLLNDQYVKEARERVGSQDFVPSQLTPKDIVNLVLDYCVRVTTSSRDFMENNPGLKLPSDYKLYPGKMDHTTCVAVRVGK